MHVVSDRDRPDLAALVLRGLADLGSTGSGETDLCLELGLSFWIRRSGVSLDAALSTMRVVRAALVGTSGMDSASEPIPFCGVDPRLDVVNLGGYLRGLIARAAAAAGCSRGVVVDRALEWLAEIDGAARVPAVG